MAQAEWGEVYRAKDYKLDRHVAIKVLNEQFSRNESNLQRFIQEAKAASRLNHPNILVIHEIGESEVGNYIVSEFIDGKTLREVLREIVVANVGDTGHCYPGRQCTHRTHTAHIWYTATSNPRTSWYAPTVM